MRAPGGIRESSESQEGIRIQGSSFTVKSCCRSAGFQFTAVALERARRVQRSQRFRDRRRHADEAMGFRYPRSRDLRCGRSKEAAGGRPSGFVGRNDW